jgi:transcriptional regulator with XRE-family HTH domain
LVVNHHSQSNQLVVNKPCSTSDVSWRTSIVSAGRQANVLVVSDQETLQSPDTGHAGEATTWGVREAVAIGRRIARRRDILRLSAQDVADRCARLGMSSLTRQVLSRMEHGRRESVSTAELAVLAAALEIAPILLLYPVGLAAEVEYLPGHVADPLEAARWWDDEAALAEDGSISAGDRTSVVMLFDDHEHVLAELSEELAKRGASLSEGDYWRLRRQPTRPGGLSYEDRLVVMAVVALREMRDKIRALGLEPPALPPHLKWLDEPGT